MKTNKNEQISERKLRLIPYKRAENKHIKMIDEDCICDGCGGIFDVGDLNDEGYCPRCARQHDNDNQLDLGEV